ncbi:MAG: alanine dehydrogenase [Ignavibacteriales bacterium CG12_big_fil_rev_8_21_14_0_65_30_8]|nr:MAG: alanine dehydrogenase [Ignavibacteriales bacterium CG12_big_fil_rev_8_21_14_0_65_30_8]
MYIGVPKEIKTKEFRVALLPVGVATLIKNGHKVVVETGAGLGSSFTDEDYKAAGAEIASGPEEIFANVDMIMKVKEPIKKEHTMIREGQIVFTYFHFAADKILTQAMIDSKCIAIAYETVQRKDGSLPLLIPMSEVAGRMASQEGAKYLEKASGGRGVLLGGVPGTGPGEVIVLGGGIVGTNSAKIASGLGAKVTIFDNNLYRLRYLDDVMPKNVFTMMSNEYYIREALPKADLVIGAILIPGGKAPHLITKEMLKLMKPGSVLVDVAVDQGGCIETTKPTTHDNPTFIIDDIVHYCVANMPGAVPHTSTLALTNATLPYAVEIANKGYEKAVKTNEEIKLGLNVIDGKVTYKAVADAFDMKYQSVEEVIG